DATEAAARYARYLGAQAMTEPGRARFTLAQDTALSLLEPARLAEQFPAVEPTALPMPVAMVVEVQSLASAKTHLEGQGVEAVHHGQRLHVAPEAAAGVALVFEQAPPVRALAPCFQPGCRHLFRRTVLRPHFRRRRCHPVLQNR